MKIIFKEKLKDFKIDIQTLDLNLKYFGFRWWHLFYSKKNFLRNNLDKVDMIIDLQSKLRNTLILKKESLMIIFIQLLIILNFVQKTMILTLLITWKIYVIFSKRI